MNGQIYITINKVNGKTYVGKHNGKDPWYIGSGTLISRSIEKYGKENFDKKILVEGIENIDFLNELEKHYIRLLSPPQSNKSYNLTGGGEGLFNYSFSEKSKILTSNSLKSYFKNNPNKIKRGKDASQWGKTNKGPIGLIFSEERKLLLSKRVSKEGNPKYKKEITYQTVIDCALFNKTSSIALIAKYLSVDQGTISRRLEYKNISCKEFKIFINNNLKS